MNFRQNSFLSLELLNLSCGLSTGVYEVKCSLTELTTRTDCSQLLSVVLLYLHMRGIPHALRGTAYSSVWQECAGFFFPSLPLPPSTFHCLPV